MMWFNQDSSGPGEMSSVTPKIVENLNAKRYLNSKTNSKWLNIHSLLVLANEFAEPSREVRHRPGCND